MDSRHRQLEQTVAVSALLGYLNFADGRPDPRWQKQLNDAFAYYAGQRSPAPWADLLAGLSDHLEALHSQGGAAFRDITQARAVLALTGHILPAYREHHADLLAHLTDEEIFGPFFIARVLEGILSQRARGAEEGANVPTILARLNDFVGHRPLALLESRPQGEPYDHERHRPLPLYLRGAGVSFGRYQEIIEKAVEVLSATNASLLAEAALDMALLDEIALDLRAYDHGHPVNRRPNYVFGEWDPHHLDNQGRFRRLVIRKVSLDGLMERIEQPSPLPRPERLLEGASVLAGTMLMAAGVSGSSPTAHDSTVTLGTLVPRIARYRDLFYEQLLARLGGSHATRLRQEQQTTRQPFGGARQHLNTYLARHRATQLQQRYLSLLFAEMGYPEASQQEATKIPAVSIRLLSQVLGRLTTGQVLADTPPGAVSAASGPLHQAARMLPEIEGTLQRGIACGAFVDPWNILGFQGLFPLSPAREDATRDPRIEELIQVVEQTFHLYARLMAEAAALGEAGLVEEMGTACDHLASWWDRFATVEVSTSARPVNGQELASAARQVATALGRWHQRGETPADLTFWRGQLSRFRAPAAFARVIDTLLHRADFRAARALLVYWAGQAEQVPLEDGHYSFHNTALRWMLALTRPEGIAGPGILPDESVRRDLVTGFFAHLEANAEEVWQVPSLEVLLPMPEEVDEEDDLYGAAYEEMTYEDSTDDKEGAVSDGGPPPEEFDLEREAERLEKRLRFLSTVARLWQVAARYLGPSALDEAVRKETQSQIRDWLATAWKNSRKLLELLDTVGEHSVPEPSGDYESLVEFDRRRVLKEQLLYSIIGTCLDTSLAVGALRGAWQSLGGVGTGVGEGPAWEPAALRLERALFAGDAPAARQELTAFLGHFQDEPLLFMPLSNASAAFSRGGGGDPRGVLRTQLAQTVLRALLANLPRLGLLRETFDLLRTARDMEQAQAARQKNVGQGGPRGLTEFNHFFQIGFQAVIESVVVSSASWGEHDTDEEIVDILQRLTAPFRDLWLQHSRTLHLSVLESLTGDSEWRALQGFVQRYGSDLFQARFMTLANLRGILHRGVSAWMDYTRENPDPLHPIKLLDEIGRTIRREDAVRRLEVVLQAVVENYEEYKDYNTTTTQSDYGENLHVLLDFLRLKVAYERHAWQFRPLVLCHEVLARRGRASTAVRWERSLTQYTRDLSTQHLERLAALERQYGVRLSTIADRLNERFVKPLALDRLCALIEPSLREARGGGPFPSFTRLQQELVTYTNSPAGVGLDVPAWLRRLEAEVHKVQAARGTVATLAENFFRIPRQVIDHAETERQLREWERPSLPR